MKITCDVIQDLMPSYIDGILSEDSRALVEEHMGTCQECRKMLEIMKEVLNNYKNTKIIENDNESSRNNCLVVQKKLCDKKNMLSQLTLFSVYVADI